MNGSRATEFFSGLPVVGVSSELRLADERAFCGLRIVEAPSLEPGSEAAAWPDFLALVAASAAEKAELEAGFVRRGIAPPPMAINPTRGEAAAFLAEALSHQLAAAVEREAAARQSLISMRQEAEETRLALTRLRQRAAEALAPLSLELVFEAEPSETEIAVSREFELSAPTTADIYGLSALALRLEGRRLAEDDALEIALVGVERSETLANWRVPASEIPSRLGWLTLDLPVSLAQARQTACAILSGRLGPEGEIAFSRAAPNGAGSLVALRLFAARAPRLAPAPFFRPLAVLDAGADPVSIPARCWTGAKLLGAGTLQDTAHGDKHLSLRSGADALLVFPEVPLAGVHAVAIRFQALDDGEVAATAALLPSGFEGASEAAQAAALEPSAPQIVRGEAAVSLTLIDPPAVASLAVALRAEAKHGAASVWFRCLGVWLLRRPRQTLSMPLAAAWAPAQLPDAFFEEVRLDETYAGETYRHLDVTLVALSEGAVSWESVKFKLFEERGVAGLEFRDARHGPACFVRWPGVEADSFGPFYKLSGPAALEEAIATLTEESDRRLLKAIRSCLTAFVRALASRGKIDAGQAADWARIAESLGREAE